MDLILTDPPYGLVFMSKEWDRETPAVEVWLECYRVLKPGGFILVMASPRNDDLVSVSLREAGFVKHNSIAYEGAIPAKMWWVYGSGFPKGTDVSKAIDAKAVRAWLSQHDHGLTAKEVSKVVSAAVNGEFYIPADGANRTQRKGATQYGELSGCGVKPRTAGALLISELEEKFGEMPKRVKVGKYKLPEGGDWNLEQAENPEVSHAEGTFTASGVRTLDITASATPLAKEFKGMKYGIQALKPAAEVILVFQKPFEGSPLENILKWRVGCVAVDRGRIETGGPKINGGCKGKYPKKGYGYNGNKSQKVDNTCGRYPSNFLLSHSPGCRVVGERRVKGITGGTGEASKKVGGRHDWKPTNTGTVADADGKETVREYECVAGCAVAELDRQSGERPTGDLTGQPRVENKIYNEAGSTLGRPRFHQGDTGTASRFFKQPEWGPADFRYVAKASSAERNAGCEGLPQQKKRYQDGRGQSHECFEMEGCGRKTGTIAGNAHPTVKPIELARYLIKLYRGNNPNSVILDPFAGSGWVEIACILESCKSLSIEAEWEYVLIGEARSVYWKRNRTNYLANGTLPKYRPELPLFEED